MRVTWLKRLVGGVLLLLVLAAAAAGIYIYRAFPVLDGSLQVRGLGAAVSIARDTADVTHIQAQSPHDAWFSLGYVHAQERGWQMEFNRRVMHGELSEILGEATLETDKLLRTLGIARAAQRQWEQLPAEGRNAMQAYSDGISAFYAQSPQALPPEFHLLGVKPGGASGVPWSPQDSLGWSLMMALDLGGNWGTEFARLSASKALNTRELWQLFPPYPGEQPASAVDFSQLYAGLGIYKSTPPATKTIAGGAGGVWAAGLFDEKNAGAMKTAMANGVNDWARGIGLVDGKGSNNWVVAGNHTESGRPLMANDPHLGLSSPALWYFARLQAPASATARAMDVVGATLPGLPFVVLGRTRGMAWGFTNTNPDVQDLYIEQINPADPGQYRVPAAAGSGAEAWADFARRTETIHVKGKADVVITVRETRHGPVLSDAQQSHAELLDTGKYVLALRWAALDADNQTVLAGLRANRAQTADQLLDAFAAYHSPMQNVVTADTTGQVAFKAVGKVPLRRADNDIRGVAPSPGWDARYDWAGWLPYAATPQTGNADIAARGWLATANQRITPPGYPHFIGQDWTVPYRHDRIEQLLAATPKHNLRSMQAIQADQQSGAALKLLPFLQQAIASAPDLAQASPVLKGMADFDGVMRADSAAPLVFAAWADELTRGIVGGKLGNARFRALYGKRNFRGVVEDAMATDDRNWCGPAGCAAQSVQALRRALDRLQLLYGADAAAWRWGTAHNAISSHRPLTNVPVLARFFDVRAPTGGDTYTVNVGQYWTNDEKTPFASRQAASLRAVYDFSNLENSVFIYQTGQSGLVFSPRYRDMSDEWQGVRYRPLKMDPAGFTHQLTLQP
jgi:penicillin G amidase